jgi:hypothetical protein
MHLGDDAKLNNCIYLILLCTETMFVLLLCYAIYQQTLILANIFRIISKCGF